MLGAGWSVTGTPTAPAAVAVFVRIPWDRTNEKLQLSLSLRDADGAPVRVNEEQVAQEGVLEAGRPPGLEHGATIDLPFILPVPPLLLPPGRYEWRLSVADHENAMSFKVNG